MKILEIKIDFAASKLNLILNKKKQKEKLYKARSWLIVCKVSEFVVEFVVFSLSLSFSNLKNMCKKFGYLQNQSKNKIFFKV